MPEIGAPRDSGAHAPGGDDSGGPPRPEIPEEIVSERLSLRAPHPRYAAEMNAAIAESLPELRRWMPWAQTLPTLPESRQQQIQAREAFLAREDLQLILFQGDRIIGSSGLHRIDWDIPKFEIGYWVRTPDSGRGYATEAVEALERFAFDSLGARRIEIRSATTNWASRAIPERLGYQLEGILRSDSRHADGSLRDTAVYARIR